MPTLITGAAGFIGAKIAYDTYELMKSDYVAIGDGDSFSIKSRS